MHFIFEPLDIMYRKYGIPWAHGCAGAVIAKLASLVPKPRVNLTGFHGFFVGMPHHPNSQFRLTVTPAKRGKGEGKQMSDLKEDKTPDERRTAMTWAHQK
jgi:hypothetical protein